MSQRLFLLSFLLSFLVCATAAMPAQDSRPVDKKDPAPSLEVTVPIYANSTCPIMGKPASAELFTDSEQGRIYVCCLPCVKKIQSDLDRAMKAAYPRARKAKNELCPVMGKPIKEGAPSVVVQGIEIKLCCDACKKEMQTNLQVFLAKAMDPNLVDVKNTVCPVTGKPTEPNAFCVIGKDLVRLSSQKCVAEVKEDPAGILAKAKSSVAKPADKK
jgi:hypothetical protein